MYLDDFIPHSIKLDPKQQAVASYFEKYAKTFSDIKWFDNFLSPVAKQQKYQGIYLHGAVGRGKTMLMQAFFDMVNSPKKLIHYQPLMQEIHLAINKPSKHHNQNIEQLSTILGAQTKLLCIDEFEIQDITDAMLMMSIFKYLMQQKIFIVLTTNTEPDNLYQDGLQRELFLPFIHMLHKEFLILPLNHDKDYRLDKVSYCKNRIFDSWSNNTKVALQKIIHSITDHNPCVSQSVISFGREVKFLKTYSKSLFTTFDELIMQDLSYTDYVNICYKFSIIIVENIPIIQEDENNLITRFINFIDNAYFNKVLLFLSLEKPIEEIYITGSKILKFKRVISRIHAMNSHEYLIECQKHHKKI